MTPSPSDPRGTAARERAIALRHARGVRLSAIRRRVVASALALFVATWLLITMLLVSGHDPALARSATRTTASSAGSTTTSNAASSGSSSGSSDATTTATTSSGTTSPPSSSSSGSSSSQSSGTSSLTSSQS